MVNRCETCDRWIKFKDDHDWTLHVIPAFQVRAIEEGTAPAWSRT